MRIGIVTSSYALSATDTVTAGIFVRQLAEELSLMGEQVHVITPRKSGPILTPPAVQEYYLPWLGRDRDLTAASIANPITFVRYVSLILSGLVNVPRYARSNCIDVLLAMWVIPSGMFCWIARRLLGIPYGVWALGSDIWARERYPFGDSVVRHILRHASFRLADGIRLAQEVERLAQARSHFVPSVRRLSLPQKPQPVELAADGCHFLFIGRYEHNKGPDILLDAMRLLIIRGTSSHLHMFGVGSLEPALRKMVKGLEDRVQIHGYADPETAAAYMSACDWLVIPSRIESIPLVFADALQMRIPVIATDVGDLGDLVRRFDIGTVVPRPEAAMLADAMHRASTENRRKDPANWEAAIEEFDLAQSAATCVRLLREALGRTE